MAQKLATRNADSVPLDFGLNIVFDADGMHAAGRADSPNYRGATFEHLTAADVTLTDVADDYEIPGPVVTPTGRDLNKAEFLDVGLATDAVKMNGVLVQMPLVSEYLADYAVVRGIIYSDLGHTSSRFYRLVSAAKASGLIDDAFVVAFMGNWATMYPA